METWALLKVNHVIVVSICSGTVGQSEPDCSQKHGTFRAKLACV